MSEPLIARRLAAFAELDRPGIRNFCYHGGRASGKSNSIALTLLAWGLKGNLRVLCLRETLKSLKDSSKQLLTDWIDAYDLRSDYEVLRDEIRGPDNTVFRFAGLRDSGGIRSMANVNVAWGDEAHEFSEESLRVLRPTIREKGVRLLFSYNPQSRRDAVDRYFRDPNAAPPNSLVREVNYLQNPYVLDNPDLMAEIEHDKARDLEMYLHVWLGGYREVSSASVFKDYTVEDIDDQLTEKSIPRLGLDFGFAQDPHFLTESYFVDNAVVYIRRETFAWRMKVEQLAERLQGFESVRARHPVVCDSSRPESVAELNDRGVRAVSAKKGPGSVMAGLEWLRERPIVVHPSCERTLQEVQHLKYRIDPQTDAVLPELAARQSDHAIDSIRYAFEGVRKGRKRQQIGVIAPQIIHVGGADDYLH